MLQKIIIGIVSFIAGAALLFFIRGCEVSDIRKGLQSAIDRNTELEKQSRDLTKTISSLDERISGLDSIIVGLRTEANGLRSDKSKLEQTNRDFAKINQQFRQLIADYKAGLGNSEATITEINEGLDRIEGILTKIKRSSSGP